MVTPKPPKIVGSTEKTTQMFSWVRKSKPTPTRAKILADLLVKSHGLSSKAAMQLVAKKVAS
jgi:hypothetical protein